MTRSVNSLMRSGDVSGRAVAKRWKKPAILNATRIIPAKMADFDGKSKDESATGNSGSIGVRKEVNASAQQRDRVNSMPSKKTGGAGFGALTRGSKSRQGGRVLDSYTPGRHAIDQYPQKQGSNWPKGGGYGGGRSNKTGNTRMKGKQPVKSGGPPGGNANKSAYYGGPNGRDGT